MANLSIVIPTLNEERFIAPLLESIANQTDKPAAVYVVDGGSTDRTGEIIHSFKNRLNVQMIPAPLGIGLARNRGADAAQTKYLLFLDSDVELEDRQFIAKALADFEARRLGIAGAHFYAGANASAFDRFGARLISYYHALFQYSKRIPMGSGFCILTTKTFHQKVGGFNETYRHSEDHDYVARIVQAGAKFRILKGPKFKLSHRRYQHGGRLAILALYTRAEINRIFFNYRWAPREKALYNFGIFNHGKKK